MKKSRIFSKIPTLLTLLNLIFGFLSIVLVLQGRVLEGVLVLFASFFFDLMDGLIARMFGWESRIGVELDSLADDYNSQRDGIADRREFSRTLNYVNRAVELIGDGEEE